MNSGEERREKIEFAKEERICLFMIFIQNEDQGLLPCMVSSLVFKSGGLQVAQEGRVTCPLLLCQREYIQVIRI